MVLQADVPPATLMKIGEVTLRLVVLTKVEVPPLHLEVLTTVAEAPLLEIALAEVVEDVDSIT